MCKKGVNSNEATPHFFIVLIQLCAERKFRIKQALLVSSVLWLVISSVSLSTNSRKLERGEEKFNHGSSVSRHLESLSSSLNNRYFLKRSKIDFLFLDSYSFLHCLNYINQSHENDYYIYL